MKRKITVIRTAVGCLSAMSLVKELKKENFRVIGLDCNPKSPGPYLCDKGYIVPRGDDPKFIEEVIKICKKEKPDAIISGPEDEVISFSRNKKIFEEMGITIFCPDYDSVKICVNKIKTFKFFKKIGIDTPEIYTKENLRFPCIIKPVRGRGGVGVFKINNRKEFDFYSDFNKDFIIQEFVDGVEYSIDTFSDMSGNPLSIVPRIRINTESGISVKSITAHDGEIIDHCKKILKKLKIIGPACIQCIKNNEGNVKFTEINPRFGGGSILSIKADPSIIANLKKIIKGETPTPSKKFRKDLLMMRYYSEFYLNKNGLLGIKT